MDTKYIHMVTFLLMVVGSLNWLLVGAFGFNLVTMLVGAWPIVESAVYVLVGLAAIYEVTQHKACCLTCSTSATTTQ